MTLPTDLGRRDLFMKIGIFLNGIVGVVLAVPVVRYLLSPLRTSGKGAMTAGFRWATLGSFLPVRRASPPIETLLSLRPMEIRQI